jgi:hypothetical protein
MLVALILIAIITIIGATSLSIAGVDQRVANYTRRHVSITNAADAGSEHARMQLMFEVPESEGWDTAGQLFVEETDAQTWFEGDVVSMPLGNYDVDASFAKCGQPPPGYSTEEGTAAFRADYWQMDAHSWFESIESAGDQSNPSEARVTSMVRKVMRGACTER